MTVTRGKHHVFLGMDITYRDDSTVAITMKNHIREAITDSTMNISRSAATPAKKDLFYIDETSPLLEFDRAVIFHHCTAMLLYVTQRARSDVQLAVAFLCTRVSCSTEQDWKKLERLLQYLYGTLDLALILGADSLTVLKTWVDASYAVHGDMKSHTGGVISLGRGALMCKSTKQKLNTKSSTESELVGASDYLPNTIWAKLFLGAQGYEIEEDENKFAQDNKSAILLETNGRASCGQKTRHIDIRYFFMKDRIKSEGITIVYCPTEQMLADFFTKPLQGNLFRKFRAVLLGHEHVDTLTKPPLPSPEERVENTGSESTGIMNSRVEVNGQTEKDATREQAERTTTRQTYASVLKKKTKWAAAMPTRYGNEDRSRHSID